MIGGLVGLDTSRCVGDFHCKHRLPKIYDNPPT